MKKLAIILLCVLAIVLSTATTAAALTIIPSPREIDLGDGLVFWLELPDNDPWFFGRDFPENDPWGVGHPKQAGLYKDGELVYSVDVDAGWWWTSLYFSDDAMSLLRVGQGRGTVRFYQRGVFVHEYSVFDLLRGGESAMLMPEPGTFQFSPIWHFWEQLYYNRENNLLRVTTVENTVISFDLSTGLILSMEEPPAQRNNGLVFIAIGAGVCVVGLIIKRKRRIK